MNNNRLTIKKGYQAKKLIIAGICYAYFLLFVYAACSKLLTYEKSELQLSKSPIISEFAFILAWLVPMLEISIAVLLMLSKTRTLALYAALALMSLFSAYIIAILNFSDTIPCSCGGVLEKIGWTGHLVFNTIFIVMGTVALSLLTRMDKTKNGMMPP